VVRQEQQGVRGSEERLVGQDGWVWSLSGVPLVPDFAPL